MRDIRKARRKAVQYTRLLQLRDPDYASRLGSAFAYALNRDAKKHGDPLIVRADARGAVHAVCHCEPYVCDFSGKKARMHSSARTDEHSRHKSTYFSHTHPDEGGRFAVSDQPPRHVVGSTPMPRYPAGPNWSADLTGVEPPLGVAIDEMVPTGEPHEIAASLGEVHNDTDPPSDVVEHASPGLDPTRGAKFARPGICETPLAKYIIFLNIWLFQW